MVHALAIAAAATAGVSVALAFELAVFKPWREENWPNGVAEGVRSELQKLRDDFGLAVSEIREDVRSLRADRRQTMRRRAERLRDDELHEFRQGIGEEQSAEVQHDGFEMHEREAEAYRQRLRDSFAGQAQNKRSEQGLQKRRGYTSEPLVHPENMSATLTTQSSPSTPCSPAVSAIAQDLKGLTFAQASSSVTISDKASPPCSLPDVDDSTASWTAVIQRHGSSFGGSDAVLGGADNAGHVISSRISNDSDAASEHIALETSGLSQTVSQQHLQDFVLASTSPSVTSQTTVEDYDAEREDSDELAFDMLSGDDSDNLSDHWSQLHSPSRSPGPERSNMLLRPMQPAIEHVLSEGESWAEVSSSEAKS